LKQNSILVRRINLSNDQCITRLSIRDATARRITNNRILSGRQTSKLGAGDSRRYGCGVGNSGNRAFNSASRALNLIEWAALGFLEDVFTDHKPDLVATSRKCAGDYCEKQQDCCECYPERNLE